MSIDSQPIMVQASYPILLSETLSEAEQQSMKQLLTLLPADDDNSDDSNSNSNLNSDNDIHNDINDDKPSNIHIKHFVDGRGLACPMPLLKTKVALRDVGINESLYVVATDPNSQADIMAFCRQSQQTGSGDQLLLTVCSVTKQLPTNGISAPCFDTIYHFIITKTDSN